MSTLADELLNDFEDESGSEIERDEEEGGLGLDHGLKEGSAGAVPGDDEDDDGDDRMADEEREYAEARRRSADAKQIEEEPNEIEKMQLSGVSDVQNVARLMKTIRPILEVCICCLALPCFVLPCTMDSRSDKRDVHRKSHIISQYHQSSKQQLSAQ